MKLKFKKLTSVVLAAALSLSLFVVPSFASADDFASLSGSVGYVYDFVDENDKISVSGTKSKLAEINSLANVGTSVDVSALLTENFKKNYASENAAKQDLLKLLGLSLGVYYSESEVDLQNALLDAESEVEAILSKITDENTDEFCEKWFDLFLLTRKDAQDSAHTISGMLPVWASGQLSELFKKMDQMQVSSIKNRLNAETEETFGKTYEDVKAAFGNLDWTVENLVAVCRNIINFVDTSNAGEFALIKAAARSSAVLTINDNEKELLFAGKDLAEEDNRIKLNPEGLADADREFELKLNVMGRDVTNLVNYNSSDNSLVTLVGNDSNKTITMTAKKGAHGVADVALIRDPGTLQDWIVRLRVVFAYDIAKADAPVWVEGKEGVVSIAPVDHATYYVVNLYKNDEFVGEKVVDVAGEVDLMEMITANDSGSYTATVTAYGDVEGEVGEESEKSAAKAYSSSLDKVAKPVWDDKTLTWNGVSGATKYTIYLYKGNAKNPFRTITVDAADGVNSYPCDEILTGKPGTYYAVVQAKSADKTGAPSDKSDGLVIKITNTITGKALLEAYEVGTTQADNSGIKVTLEEDPTIVVETDEEGNYTIEDLPDGEYNLIFEKNVYLKHKATVLVSGGEVQVDPVVLWYGDFGNTTTISIFVNDVSYIVSLAGVIEGDDEYNEEYDINKDGQIEGRELSVVVRNFGKKYLN